MNDMNAMKSTWVNLAAFALLATASLPAAHASAQQPTSAAAGAAAPAAAPISNAQFAIRRESLAAALPNGVILALGAREPSEDYLSFYQTANFRYLTGVLEPNAALVGVKRAGQVTWTLFVEPRDPAREVWSGRLTGTEAAAATWGVTGRPIATLNAFLDSELAANDTLSVVIERGSPGNLSTDDQFVAAITGRKSGVTVNNASTHVGRLRAYKSAAEQALIKRAIDITVMAHAAVASVIRPDVNEYEADAMISYTFRRNGAERAGFANIVGSGPNSTTLHYNANNRVMRAGETVVIDIGASYEGYSADMTRTYPVSGTFTAEQKAVYQLVRDAQAAVERQVKIGTRWSAMRDTARVAVASGLARLGLIDSADATYDCSDDGSRQCPQFTMYFMHGLGHGIGLLVHDPDRYELEGTMGEGSVFTIEPGVYVRENLLDILPKTARNAQLIERIRAAHGKYANIGVRIEDDYLVTSRGLVWLTRSPREVSEIEAQMRSGRPLHQ